MFTAICRSDFSHQALYDRLRQEAPAGKAGAIVTFTGLVRDMNDDGAIGGIELEHYPGMTERVLDELASQAMSRFSLISAGIVHRVGRILNHEQIVWVGCVAAHRQAAFDGACFTMDILKQSVPLWKKELVGGTGKWVAAKHLDEAAAMRWTRTSE
ncbi:molybdenum cofactor biosynthesis protein MoaE [Alteromonas halophila]|uniref:Molybdopterin synthase catalytic subunit n=1 Tax=Alteromonas halophila TaxID=516698 RepID=A0A918JNS6_9ALTE|nr:molybdenum cofactor biosynthesis protein MoaE [Alteromonas halophila]GGW89664.1 molybdopterin synthase catalytic subunit [Alteromonas halophila]